MSIEDYKFSDMYEPKVLSANETAIVLDTKDLPWVALSKADIIMLTKEAKLTAHDIECSEHAELQKYCQQLEDELIDIQTTTNNTSTRLS